MSIEGIIVGLLAIGIGLAWAFYGLKLFTILLPIWAFFFGLVAGAQWGADVFGQRLLLDRPVVGHRAGVRARPRRDLVLLVLRRDRHPRRRRRLRPRASASSSGSASSTGPIIVIIGLIVGAIFAIGTFVLGVPVLLVMVFSAFSGAAAVVNGVLIFLGQIKLDGLQAGHLRRRCSRNGIVGDGHRGSSLGRGRLVLADPRRRPDDHLDRPDQLPLLSHGAAVARRRHRPGDDEQPLHPLRPVGAAGRQPPAGARPDHAATGLGRARRRRDPRARADLHPGRAA